MIFICKKLHIPFASPPEGDTLRVYLPYPLNRGGPRVDRVGQGTSQRETFHRAGDRSTTTTALRPWFSLRYAGVRHSGEISGPQVKRAGAMSASAEFGGLR